MSWSSPPVVRPGPLTPRAADELNEFLRRLGSLLGGFAAAPPLSVSQDEGGVVYRLDDEIPDPDPGYTTYVGDGSSTTFTVTHDLGTRDLIPVVTDAAPPYEVVYPTIAYPTADTMTVTFLTAPSANQYRILLLQTGGAGVPAAPVLPPQFVTLTTTPTNNQTLDPGVPGVVFTLTTSDVTLTGLTPTDPGQSRTVTITNSPASTKLLTLSVEDALSTATSRFYTPTATSSSLVLPPGSSVTLTYDLALSRWVTLAPAPPPPWQPSWSGTVSNPTLPPGATFLVVAPTLTGPATLTGFPATLPPGVTFVVTNPTTNSDNLTLANGSGSSFFGFTFSSGADVVLPPGKSVTVTRQGSTLTDSGFALSLASAVALPPTPPTTVALTAVPTWFLVKTLTHSDLTSASTSQNVTAYTIPAGAAYHGHRVKTKTAGSGGTVSALTTQALIAGVSAGNSGNAMLLNDTACQGFNVGSSTRPFADLSTTTRTFAVQFVSTGGNVNAITVGEWECAVLLSNVG